MLGAAAWLVFLCLPIAAQDVGKITGTVTDAATRQPIPKVHVGSVTGDPGSNTFVGTLTGPDGGYVLENVPAGQIRVTVNLDGYKFVADPPGREPGFRLSAGETVRRDYVLHRRGRIYGHLIDRDSGAPITGHLVMAVRAEPRPGQTAYLEFSGSQRGAEFEIPELDAGLYYLQIESNAQPGFVFPSDASPPPAPEVVYGECWYPGVRQIEQAAAIRLGEGEERAVNIALPRHQTHSVSGVVEAPRELASQPLTLLLQKAGLNGAVAAMKESGSFRIDNLASGSYRLDVVGGAPAGGVSNLRDYIIANFGMDHPPPVNAVATAQFEVEDRDIDHLKIALGPYVGAAGEVRMLEENTPLPAKFGVLLSPAGGWATNQNPPPPGLIVIRVSPVTGGKFHQDGLMPGEYWPRVNGLPAGYAVAQTTVGGLPTDGLISIDGPDTPVTLVLTAHPGAVAGVVRDADQNPVPAATVVLFPDPLTNRTDRARVLNKLSAQDGSFAFRDLPPGRYHAIVLTDADAENQGSLAFLRNKAAGTETIDLPGGKTAMVELKR